MSLKRFILVVLLMIFSVNVRASGQSGSDFDSASILPILFIFVIILALIWLSRYVKRQQKNHVLPMQWMNASLLKGQLRNISIQLENAIASDIPPTHKDYQTCSICLQIIEKQNNIADLVKCSGLGRRGTRKIEKGFARLNCALVSHQTSYEIKTGQQDTHKKPFLPCYIDISAAITLFDSAISDIVE